MNKNFVIDYLACILLKALGPIVRRLPLYFTFCLGRMLGSVVYYCDLKHKAIAYANIKTAFAAKLSPCELKKIVKDFYRTFGENLIEIFLIPLIDTGYLNKYIRIEGLENVRKALKRNKGVILLGIHEGSWELSNTVSFQSGFPLRVFVQNQKFPRLDRLLNSYRCQKGGKVIQKKNQTRQLIELLKNNQIIGMTIDQGGRFGTPVEFFGKEASMASGAVRLALKYQAALIPAFYARVKGPSIRIILKPPFEVKGNQASEDDIRDNLQALVRIFEKYIAQYPQEYLWIYKIWKYSRERNILILHDGKTGHLRQSEALAKIASGSLEEKGYKVGLDTREVKFKNNLAKKLMLLGSLYSGKYACQGCAWCLKHFLQSESYQSLMCKKPDIIVSCGSSLAAVTHVLAHENLAKSIVIMRPSILSMKRFYLVVMPRHDNPPKEKNIVVTDGALNLIDEEYLKTQSERLADAAGIKLGTGKPLCIGLLLGGDTKNFRLNKDIVSQTLSQIKLAAESLNADVLATTSRRTPKDVEELLKREFTNFSRCKLLVVANEKNVPGAVGAIAGLSRIVVVSPESISMISEAACAGRYIIVFTSRVDRRHRRFLDHMAKRRYIYLCRPQEIAGVIETLNRNLPEIRVLQDTASVTEALQKVLQ